MIDEYINTFLNIYSTSLPYITLAALFYVLYLLLIRQSHFKAIEHSFNHSIQTYINESSEKFNEYINNAEDNAEVVANNIEELLNRELFGIKNNLEEVRKESIELKNSYERFKAASDKHIQEQRQLYAELKSANEEIKKRDAVIFRKEKQIRELKNGR